MPLRLFGTWHDKFGNFSRPDFKKLLIELFETLYNSACAFVRDEFRNRCRGYLNSYIMSSQLFWEVEKLKMLSVFSANIRKCCLRMLLKNTFITKILCSHASSVRVLFSHHSMGRLFRHGCFFNEIINKNQIYIPCSLLRGQQNLMDAYSWSETKYHMPKTHIW